MTWRENLVSHIYVGSIFWVTKNISNHCCSMACISGYNFQCDIKQLAHSYEELECFKKYKRLLDIQKVFKDPRGGLAKLAEVLYLWITFSISYLSFCWSDICGWVMIKALVFLCYHILTKFVCLLVNQKILGAGLNKTRRNSDWEQRPLTPNQVIYPLFFFFVCY